MIRNLTRAWRAGAARSAILVLVFALLAAACSGSSAARSAAEPDRTAARAGSEPQAGANGERQEESDALQERIDAFEQAKADGTAGVATRVASSPAAGWTGEYVANPKTDDWEPALAADPNGPYG